MSDEDIQAKIEAFKKGIVHISTKYMEEQNQSNDDEFF